ncbi:hypothetical protein K505DRAFT_236742 [Melanomma pulvis-pyrius CBS 109.77]|uniref:Uncharacterized protein n=1 Tax=Melanomma pulvis-pyrius CBS 109.77 TaxID=1314802 RepID=A0A6A6XJZ7_9PLEO|nr:hypothetical protein K505DRAFT_236742 [Melanomma pulvis-pyrius CBS 109.77]
MPLRKHSKPAPEASGGKAETKKSRRQRIADFFRSRKQRKEAEKKNHVPADKGAPRKPARDSKIAELTQPAKSSSSVEVVKPEPEQPEQTPQPSPPPEPKEKEQDKDKDKVEPLSDEQIHALFSGAPHFSVQKTDDGQTPRATFPWDEELKVKDVSDSAPLPQSAFSAATLHRHLPTLQQAGDQDKIFQGYDMGVTEVPSMLSAQGIEPGTVGFVHFLELSKSDNLVTDLQQSESSNGFLEAMRNKEQMQSNPERLGIRRVDMSMLHDRLIELGDLFEAFQDSPERITILNNQSSGDLYANLFGKFLTPPRYDDAADDPLGMKVQIDTLLKILRLKGVWYDFSLVEWRIRLGQILWSDGEALPEHKPHQLWDERDILLLQITLSCELLLRLDAVSSMDTDAIKGRMHLSPEDYRGFLNLKTRKTDWDMVLARRFLENILVIKESDTNDFAQTPKPRGLLSMLSRDDPKETPNNDIILLPRHQARQLSGLLYFAETIQWPQIDLMVKELAQKLGISDSTKEPQQPASPYGKFLDPSTPSSVSVYGTPLATPRSTVTIQDSYFGQMTKPALSRNNSRSLNIPLSTALLGQSGDAAATTMNVGGWLSRSYLTGLVLPGEGISHFLMSTLLENDKLAIATLGDSANLYGGFIYAGRSWWSKSAIVARVLACLEGALECMGWISIIKPPESLPNGWYALNSEQLQLDQPTRIEAEDDLVAMASATTPGDDDENVNPEHFTLPLDPSTPPIPSVEYTGWNLTPISSELSDNEALSGSPSETETHIASLTFTSFARGNTHTFTLTHDVQFITSFPCTPPAASPIINLPQILNPSLSQTLTRSSSKRSIHSTRSGNRLSRHMSRRNSHGFEPLFSHPPDSPGIAPTPIYSPLDAELEEKSTTSPKSAPMMAHPLYKSYKFKIVPVTEVLDPNFILPFTMHSYASSTPEDPGSVNGAKGKVDASKVDDSVVLVLDARASKDLELLARAWCAEKGLHAIIGRVGRSCLACCVREARGLGVRVVVRV